MLTGKRILLGIAGGIAAYKGPALVRALMAQGAEVRVVMTRGASHFVTPLSLQSVSGNAVGQDLFDPAYEAQIGHIELARWPDAILIAPTTAHLIAKVAHGLCDDLLTTVLCATTVPVVMAPAMNTQMFLNPAVQDNLTSLARRPGFHVIPPDEGELACLEVGPGRMPDPPVMLETLIRTWMLQDLAGRHVVISAGPTREFIDPVRFLTNPSSGKMGFAIARQAARRGAKVTLVTGHSAQETPHGVTRHDVVSAQDMHDALMGFAQAATPPDLIIKSAAVADWRPANVSEQKTKKRPGDWHLEMVRTPDILAALGALKYPTRPVMVGFAAETQDLVRNAKDKLQRKGLDLIVANRVIRGDSAFGADQSKVTFLDRRGGQHTFGPAPKDEVATELLNKALALASWA